MILLTLIASTLLGHAAPTNEELDDRLKKLEHRLSQYEAQAPSLSDPSSQPMGHVIPFGEVVPEVHRFMEGVDVYGEVTGDVSVIGDDIHVRPGGRIQGDATTLWGEIRVSEGGHISGNKLQITPSILRLAIQTSSEIGKRVIFFMTCSAIGVFLVGLFPGRIENMSINVAAHPARSLIIGSLWATVISLASIVLTLICIGTPLALLFTGILGLSWLLGFASICEVIGHRIRITEKSYSQWLAFLIGAAVLTVLSTIPYAGAPILCLISLMGIGTAFQTRFGGRIR